MYITIIYASFQPESRHVQPNAIVPNGHSNNGVSIIGTAPAGLTRCGFIAVGQCDAVPCVQDGVDYSAAAQVFLKAAEPL